MFGSEGYGLNHQTKRKFDFIFRININKDVESLNISNSAAVVFHYISNSLKNEKKLNYRPEIDGLRSFSSNIQ